MARPPGCFLVPEVLGIRRIGNGMSDREWNVGSGMEAPELGTRARNRLTLPC